MKTMRLVPATHLVMDHVGYLLSVACAGGEENTNLSSADEGCPAGCCTASAEA